MKRVLVARNCIPPILPGKKFRATCVWLPQAGVSGLEGATERSSPELRGGRSDSEPRKGTTAEAAVAASGGTPKLEDRREIFRGQKGSLKEGCRERGVINASLRCQKPLGTHRARIPTARAGKNTRRGKGAGWRSGSSRCRF